MNYFKNRFLTFVRTLFSPAFGMLALVGLSRLTSAEVVASPYRILQTRQIPGSGGIDYVTADKSF